ncbi:MAG TPA: hypothetical protein VGN51_02530 [Acidimicrobiia bacterium]|jgi:hypothetical protein
MRGLTVGATALLLTVVGLAPPAAAQTAGGGELGPDYVRATASDLGAGTFPGSGLPAAVPAVDPPYTWERADTGGRCVVFAGAVPAELVGWVSPLPGLDLLPYVPIQIGAFQGGVPGAVRLDGDAPLPPGAVLVGTFVIDTASPRDGGPGTFFVPRCSPPGEPLPPALPDAATIWQQTPLPRAHIHASPPGTRDWPGIVNLESRFWGDPLADVRATVNLDGYVVDVSARPMAYGWAFDDGTTSVGSSPGSAGAPLRATFRRRGDHGLALYVTWAGFAHITAPALGLDFGLQYLGTVTLPVAGTHHVAEIRALLRSH